MGLCISTTSRRQFESTGRIGQGPRSGDSQPQRSRITVTSIHVLDDYSLLHVFYLCRPFFLGEDDIAGSLVHWRSNARWWYTLSHVCQRWRNIVLGSVTYLGLSLVCTYGTPVTDMLAYSPPLPLVVGYFKKNWKLSTEEETGIIFALKQRDRVRRVRLGHPFTIMQNLIVAMDEEYPILEYLYITRPIEDNSTILGFPESFQAPHLRYLGLRGFSLPIGSLLLTTAVGLVTLHLDMVHPSTYFPPNTLIQWISLMPLLETLKIYFEFPIPNRNVESQHAHVPIIAAITLPNLHHFHFRGVSTYLEVLLHRITTPRLEMLQIEFFNQLTFSVPRLLQFMNVTENLRFDSARFTFSGKKVDMAVYPYGETKVYSLGIVVKCCHFEWQVSSMAQISNSLGQMFSVVEHLVFQRNAHSRSPEEHNEVDRTEWRKFLRPFSSVKTLRIESGLVKDLSLCLQLEDGELPLEVLPELHDLTYSGRRNTVDAFTSFIDARQNAGRPVTLVRR